MTPILIVPRGAEEAAVRRGAPRATIVPIRAGARAADLAETLPGGPIVVLGLCGGLRGVQTGDCVIFRDVIDDIGRFTFDDELVRALHTTLPHAILVRACTTDHVITRANERAALAAAYTAGAVDMEGTHIARALMARGRAAMIVRVVSDDPRFDLPPIEDAFDAKGALRPFHLARAFAAKPAAALRFVRDVRSALHTLSEVAAKLTRNNEEKRERTTT